MATVVVVFVDTFDVSSIPTLAVVIAASVDNGGISDNVPTNVVLPTPKPPAMTIFAERGATAGVAAGFWGETAGEVITSSGSFRPWRSGCRGRWGRGRARRPPRGPGPILPL